MALQDLDLPSDLFMHIHVLHLSLVYDLDGHLHKHVSTPLTVVIRGSLPRVVFFTCSVVMEREKEIIVWRLF